MKKLILALCITLNSLTASAGVIDATSLETLTASLEGESKEDVVIIGRIVKDLAAPFGKVPPLGLESTMARIKKELHGKTVAAVILEHEIKEASATAALNRKAEKLVAERRAKWRQRAENFRSIKVGMYRETMQKLMGEPDAKSDSPITQNWFYRCDAAHNAEQIWIEGIFVKMQDGIITEVKPSRERKAIGSVKPFAEKTAKKK